jgi:hypothetical protein
MPSLWPAADVAPGLANFALLVFWKRPPWVVVEEEGLASLPDGETAHSEGNPDEL